MSKELSRRRFLGTTSTVGVGIGVGIVGVGIPATESAAIIPPPVPGMFEITPSPPQRTIEDRFLEAKGVKGVRQQFLDEFFRVSADKLPYISGLAYEEGPEKTVLWKTYKEYEDGYDGLTILHMPEISQLYSYVHLPFDRTKIGNRQKSKAYFFQKTFKELGIDEFYAEVYRSMLKSNYIAEGLSLNGEVFDASELDRDLIPLLLKLIIEVNTFKYMDSQADNKDEFNEKFGQHYRNQRHSNLNGARMVLSVLVETTKNSLKEGVRRLTDYEIGTIELHLSYASKYVNSR